MGKSMMNSNEKYAENFVRSEAGKLLAEVFFRELQFISGDGTLSDRLVVRNRGMNSRVRSQDVLGIQTEDLPNTSKERVVLDLARNGIYHQLPEFLFHPISLSTPSMTNSEVVAAMRANRKKEEEAIRFFQPFDTEFFKDGVNMFKRSLSLFDDPCSNRILQNVATLFSLQASSLKMGEKYRLMLFLCNAREYKENLPALEVVLHTVFHMRVALQYRPHHISESPYKSLGECRLGMDSGLSGTFTSELEDVEAKIYLEENIGNEGLLREKMDAVRFVLSFFIISSRHVNVIYTVEANTEFVLGTNLLGYDTNL